MATRGKRNNRKGKRASRQRGGWRAMNPAAVSDASMQGPSALSTAQGREYDSIHQGQHGGAYVPMEGAPVGETGVLDDSLRATARVTPLDSSVAAIQGMRDQSGGRRKSRRSKRTKRSKRSKRSKRTKRSKRKSRRMRGGAMQQYAPADYSYPGHLLSARAEAKALMQMNPEWKLAENPNSFAPQMHGGAGGGAVPHSRRAAPHHSRARRLRPRRLGRLCRLRLQRFIAFRWS
jgi:hypothetical protein